MFGWTPKSAQTQGRLKILIYLNKYIRKKETFFGNQIPIIIIYSIKYVPIVVLLHSGNVTGTRVEYSKPKWIYKGTLAQVR